MSLKLGKLPERAPVKLTIAIDPALHARLTDYARIYSETYGATERVEDLVPFILEKFLDGDGYFKRARRALHQLSKGD